MPIACLGKHRYRERTTRAGRSGRWRRSYKCQDILGNFYRVINSLILPGHLKYPALPVKWLLAIWSSARWSFSAQNALVGVCLATEVKKILGNARRKSNTGFELTPIRPSLAPYLHLSQMHLARRQLWCAISKQAGEPLHRC